MKIGKTKKGMSLIVLVITIIVMIILSGVVVIGLSSNNPIEKANNAKLQSDFANYKEELSSYLANRLYEDYKFNPETIETKEEDMQKYIKSMREEYYDDFEIVKGELIYIGDTSEELASEIYSQGIVAYFSPLTPPVYEASGNYWYWPITMIGAQRDCCIKGAKICGWNFPAGVEQEYKNGEFSTFAGSAGDTYKSGYDPERKSYNLDGTNDYMIIDDDMITDVSYNKKATSKITNIGSDGKFTISVTAIAKNYRSISKILAQRPDGHNYNFIGFTLNSKNELAPYLGANNGTYTADWRGAIKASISDFSMNSFVKLTGDFNGKECYLYVNGKKAYTEIYNSQAIDTNRLPGYWNVGRHYTEGDADVQNYFALELKTITFWDEPLESTVVYQNSIVEEKWNDEDIKE